jgi:N-methylhydantoinase A
MLIRADLARAAIETKIARPLGISVEEAAEGILTILNETMLRAIRVITVERGYDPRKFALLAFGGAGPLLATPLARELGLSTIIVPPGPGLLCALGLLVADARRDFGRTHIVPLKNGAATAISEAAGELSAQAERWFSEENAPSKSRALDWAADLRYLGQSHEITVPMASGPAANNVVAELADAFGKEHARLYGYAADAPVELVTMRLTARVSVSRPPLEPATIYARNISAVARGTRQVHFLGVGFVRCPIYDRMAIPEGLATPGPAVIEQMDTTTIVFPGQKFEHDGTGNLILQSS